MEIKVMKTYEIRGGETTWICKAESEEAAWESLAQIKKLPVTELKKLFKLLNNDDRTSNND